MKIIRTFFSHPLISGSSIMFTGSLIVSILSYVFYFVMGRLLSVSDNGLLVTLISTTALFGIFSTALTGVFAKFTAKYTSKNDTEGLILFLGGGIRFIVFFSLVLFVIFIPFSSILASFLHIQDIRLMILLLLIIVSSVVSSVYIGFFQGQMRFYLLSFLAILSIFLKIVLAVLAVLLGFSLFGAFFAVFLSGIVPLSVGLWIVTKNREKKSAHARTFFKEVKRYAGPFFLSSLSVTLFASLDVVLVRHFFSAFQAGQYAVLSLLGKGIFYITSPIYFVLFPLVAQKKEKKEGVLGTFFLAAGIVTACSLFFSIIYFLFPNILLHLLFPADNYKNLAGYLGFYSLYIFVFSLAWLCNNFFLSLGKTKVYRYNLFCGLLFIILIFFFHASLTQVISVLLIVALALLGLLLLYFRYYERD